MDEATPDLVARRFGELTPRIVVDESRSRVEDELALALTVGFELVDSRKEEFEGALLGFLKLLDVPGIRDIFTRQSLGV